MLLIGKKPDFPEAGLDAELKRKKIPFPPLQGIEPDRPVHIQVTTSTELPRFHVNMEACVN
jgi:hypothetical protein